MINNGHTAPVLVIEDSPEDFEVLARGFGKAGIMTPLYRCHDGQEALDFVYGVGKFAKDMSVVRPSLILLDLNMPGIDGFGVLKTIKNHKDLKSIPVIVLSTSSKPSDVQKCYELGANSYIAKPESLKSYTDMACGLRDYWLNLCKLPL